MNRPVKPHIEREAVDVFMAHWEAGAFKAQRLGQAFYNHFNLHRLSDQPALLDLYAADGKKALKCINGLFEIS